MFLENLNIINFKNISERTLNFTSKINCFVGDNGIGKTNILDAIYYLANGKSYFNPIASQNIKHDTDFFMVDGMFDKLNRKEHIVCSIKKGQKKILKRNGKSYDKISEHFGLIPLVIISPADEDLISKGSDTRRKFIDSVISQQDSNYLQKLINYNKVLSQRNALLKYFAANQTFDINSLEVYNDQLEDLGTYIFKKRTDFLTDFLPIFKKFHAIVTNNKEKIDIIYESHLQEKRMGEWFNETLKKDRILQYTSSGTHKDDIQFLIENHPVKKFGSQGQKKSLLIALKLAQFEFLKNQNGELPILLFDDIFDKLDADRVKQIIQLVHNGSFGQLFISDTHKQRTELIVENLDYEIFQIQPNQ